MAKKIKLKRKNRSHRCNINRPRLKHRHKHTKCKMYLSIMMVICIKQHLSNIGVFSINGCMIFITQPNVGLISLNCSSSQFLCILFHNVLYILHSLHQARSFYCLIIFYFHFKFHFTFSGSWNNFIENKILQLVLFKYLTNLNFRTNLTNILQKSH